MVLAIDQGTSGSRALVLDASARLLATAYREFPQYFPAPGWVEHDAEEIWESVIATVREALRKADVRPRDVAGIGITNQRETTVVWENGTGRPAARAIVWQDRRTADRCAALQTEGHAEEIRARTGLVVDPYFSATKLEWLLDRHEGWRDRGAAGELLFGTIDSWIAYRLSGGAAHVTDHTNASRTLLYSLDTGTWDPRLCELFGVPPEMLPAVHASAEPVGSSSPDLFGAAIPICGIAGDQQAALYGQGAWGSGEAKNTYGTGAFLLFHTGDVRQPDVQGVLTTAACGRLGERAFAYEGAILVAGAAIQWLRDGLGIMNSADQSEDMARAVESTGGVCFVPALAGLGTPHWEPAARGTIVGISRGTRAEHLVRAALEAMAYSTAEALEAMSKGSGIELHALRVDGGAARNDWLMQFQADVLGVPVHRPEAAELTAIGAAGLAGVGAGVWAEPEEFLAARGAEDVFEPDPYRGDEVLAGLRAWKRAVRAALHWAGDAGTP